MTFRPLPEHDLVHLGDDALVAHARAARAAGDARQARMAIDVLVFAHWPRVVRRVALKVPEEDVEDVASDIVHAAIRSAFDGDSPGAFARWLATITDRRIADYHRRRERAPAIAALAAGGEEPGAGTVEPADVSHEGLIATADAVERALEALSPTHARVVEAHVLHGLPARDVAAAHGVTPDNVAQIASRFRRRLREDLRRSEDP